MNFVFCLKFIQWNPSILATLGTEIIGLIVEVATFQGLIYTHVYVIGRMSMWLL